MKKLQIGILSVVFLLTFTTNCKKKKDTVVEPTKEVKQSDQTASAEVDESMDQVNDVISNKVGGGHTQSGRTTAYNLPCGVVSIDSSSTSGANKIYKMNYGNKTKCGYKYKSGEIAFVLQSGTKFSDVGAVFQTTFTNYKVEVLATGSVVTLNGVILVTNVDGGYVWQAVTNSQTIKHKVRGTLNITYANNEVRARNYFQMRTYSNTSTGWAGLTFTVSGDSVGISETGKTYDGNYDFYTELTENFSWSNCGTTYAGPYVLKTGVARMNVTVPNVTPAYVEIGAGYDWDYTDATSTPSKVNNCSSNAYKIDLVLGTTTSTSYQLY
jgi:hypothetical protein